jgi:hypothetical protein
VALLPNRYRYWAYGCHFVDCADSKQVDYWVEVKQLSTPEAVCWEICRTDRLQAVQRSPISHRAEAMPRERALRKMLEKLDVRRV